MTDLPTDLTERLREALEPFAAVLDDYDPEDEDDEMPGTLVVGSVTDYNLTLGDLRRARSALEELSRLKSEMGELRSNYDTAQANWDLALDQAERYQTQAKNAEAEFSRLKAGEGWQERAATCADQWSVPANLRLAAGEMTAQELRTAQAVAKGIAAAIRALPHPRENEPERRMT